MRISLRKAGVCVLMVMAVSLAEPVLLRAQNYVHHSEPKLFSYDELVQLSLDQPLSPELVEKLRLVTTTPFINNEAYFDGAKPLPREVEGLGPSVRVAFWNIERGLEIDNILLFITDKDAFMAKVKEEREKAKASGKNVRDVELEKVSQEIETLKAADVWILNEVDWGMKRTGYREIIRELGKALNMNWAYGVEFLEIDPKQLGTDQFNEGEDKASQEQLVAEFSVDKDRLRALHGSAVLSRYPIRSVRIVPFTVGYDWFKETKLRPLEKGKRQASKLVGEDMMREVRRGQRMTLYVDLDMPEAPAQRVTIAATHLENRTRPKTRRKQLQELLKEVRDVPNPVIIAGDMNTSGSDSTPTSAENMLYKRYGDLDFWATKGIQLTGVGLIYTGAKTVRNVAGFEYRVDPTSANIPGASPNLERGFFSTLEKFRFADGKAIDFRGVETRTTNGTAGTLADSNQRQSKGFTPTYVTELIWGNVGVARFKLDWIFVKDNVKEPRDTNGSYLFAPHFPRTLADLNNCLPEPISDHSPMTVDLPFREPTGLSAKAETSK
ncbi:MAG TPA: endonuclease/exonuclease/phosphatase family protein [Bryobacteraceae bacterium]|jgi:endonuclease/exonuclease/phosphatase family metal-dependent hydrolase|nr:endonuclease/exonuclease/phosphatase family protein [Bryobacteraceae bacterium]